MKKSLILIFGVAVLGTNLVARDISISEAVQLAQAHSFQLKKAQAESKAYRAGLDAAQAERYPTLSLEAKAIHNSSISQLDLSLPGFSLQQDIGQHEVYQTDLRLTLPVFTGGRISSSIDLARASLQIKEALLRSRTDQIEFMAKEEYLKLYKSDRLVEAAASSLKRTELVRKDIQSLHNAGAADSVSLIEIEISFNMATLSLERASNNRRQQEIILSTLLGLSSDEPIKLIDLPQSPPALNNRIRTVSEEKPELIAARSAIALNKSVLRLDRASYAPNLSLFGGYSYGKPNISPFEEEFNGNFSVGALLNWSFNIGGKTGSQLSKARYQLRVSEHEYDRLHEQTSEQAKLAYESLKLAYSSYQIAQSTLEISRQNFRLAQIKHQQGVMSANHLLDIETDLNRAESMLYSAEADYHLVFNRYEFITGAAENKEGSPHD
ncbi:MAG: TolC family protein [bacterium]|nr:TolC family protein [bacterium]